MSTDRSGVRAEVVPFSATGSRQTVATLRPEVIPIGDVSARLAHFRGGAARSCSFGAGSSVRGAAVLRGGGCSGSGFRSQRNPPEKRELDLASLRSLDRTYRR